MLLANKRTQKTATKKARSLFFKLKSIVKKKSKAKNRLNLELKMSHNVTVETKKLIILKEILRRNL